MNVNSSHVAKLKYFWMFYIEKNLIFVNYYNRRMYECI